GNELLPVALLVVGADLEFHVGPAPGVAAPMDGRAADAFARQERAELAHRQGLLRGIVADGQRVARGVLHQIVTLDIAQLVADVRQRVVVLRRAHSAALERDHLHARRGEFLGENAAGPAETDDDDIDFLELGEHGLGPQNQFCLLLNLLLSWPGLTPASRIYPTCGCSNPAEVGQARLPMPSISLAKRM